jgi:glycosyltransferase involved in cell wall biosynthesis
VPFGVDTEFFTPPNDDPAVEWDIAAVGTNEGKDFPTLVSALSPEERCVIVTDHRNADQVRRTKTHGAITLDHSIPILQLRALYLAARRIVVPLRNIDFSSGQTVLLETLALGRPVVVTDVPPVRDYISTEVAMLVPPGDVTAMRAALNAPVPPRVAAATDHVRAGFTIVRFAGDIAAVCRQLIEK